MSSKKYKTNQPSPLPWNKEIPAHWISRRGKFLFKVINQRSEAGAEELLSVTENWGVIPRKNANVTMFQAENYEGYKLCQKGDLVINSLWAWGKGLGFSEYAGIVSTAYSVYRLKKHSEHNYRYFNYLLRTPGYVGEYLVRSKGVWISRLQLSDMAFLDMQIIIPPLAEQTAIANYLDAQNEKINLFIAKKKKLIELLKLQKQAIINKAVTKGIDENVELKPTGSKIVNEIPVHWEVRRLGTLGTFSKGGNISRADLLENEVEGFPAILYGDIYTKYEFVAKKIINKISERTTQIAKKISSGTLLMTGSGETKEDIGKCIVYLGIETVFVGGDVIIFNQKNCDSVFLSYSLSSDYSKQQKALNSKGEIIVHIYSSKLQNVLLFLPSVEEQIEIANYLNAETKRIDDAVRTIEKEIELIKEYKQSIVAEVVAGKIKVIAD